MHVTEALLSRRTIFKFLPEPVPDDVIERALEAARWAPNHKLTEPWRFYVVGPEHRDALGPIARRLASEKAEKQGVPAEQRPALLERQVQKVTELPALVVVTNKRTPDDSTREKEDYAATTCALHNLVLSLWADGFGAQWGTGGVTHDPQTYEVLQIDANAEEIIGFVKLGRPAVVPSSRRRPLHEVVVHLR